MLKSNAKTATQKKLVEEYVASLGDDAEFVDGSVTFGSGKGQNLTLAIDGEEQQGFKSYAEFRAFFSGEETATEEDPNNPSNLEAWSEAFRAQLGQRGENPENADEDDIKRLFKGGKTPGEAAEEVARQLEAIRLKEKADAEERARRQQAITEANAELDQEVAALASVIRGERSGDLKKNEARYAKGERLVRLEDLGRRLKENGDTRFKSGRDILQFARNQVREAISHDGVIDTALDKRLSDQEASATRTVYRTYMNNGLGTTFRLVDTINPETGQPYQDDAGNPPEVPISNIALNKLYILAPFHNPEDHDTLISFAHRTGEKALTAAKKLMDPEQDNAAEVIAEIGEYLASNPTTDDGEPYESSDQAIIDFVARRQGKTAPSSVKTIKVDGAFYDGTWTEVRSVATALFKHVQFTLDDKGEAGATQILERLINFVLSQYNQTEEGVVQAIADIFVEGGDITTEQASAFMEAYFAPEEATEEAAPEQEPVEA